ncbi:MAG TPA: ABC transporter ATP-binding protein [Spirochaetia bacterium]|nr:ABC transporter ATP-binding protein [Spirochaetia bacterium]
MALIRLDNVTKDYTMGQGVVHALRGLNLEVEAGELVVLLGPSGCGKTTTLNVVGGLDRPTTGAVVVNGDDIALFDDRRMTAYRRASVGFIFQFFNLIPTLTAAENVEFALTLVDGSKKTREGALELLGLVGLKERSDHFPSELSGGEQQRVSIARALANKPALLLCDEPTGNLDVGTGIQVLQAIHELNRSEGTTVLLVTHNTAIAPFSDKIVRLHDGTIDRIERVDQPRPVRELVW